MVLPGSYAVSKVRVLNRGDCCGNRLNGFSVSVDGVPCASDVQIGWGEAKEVACVAEGSSITIT